VQFEHSIQHDQETGTANQSWLLYKTLRNFEIATLAMLILQFPAIGLAGVVAVLFRRKKTADL
jgi:hypothetical protein